MNTPRLSIIAAFADRNRALGKDNKLPWHIPEDFKHFKDLTSGHVVIMGRKTFESIGKALPNRLNIIVTRNAKFQAEGCTVVDSIEKALSLAKEKEAHGEVFVIGGGEIYAQALPFTDRLYLTIIQGEFEGDTFFPEFPEFTKNVSVEIKHDAKHKFAFVTLERP